MKKLAVVSMIKNESDIIELFVRINIRQVDVIYIIDHQSTDGTAAIIERLKLEFPQLHSITWEDAQFQQAVAITSVVRHIANLNIVDYIIPLDADEFLAPTNKGTTVKEAIENAIDSTKIGLGAWATYCPINDCYFDTPAPLYNNFRRRKIEPLQYFKVVIGNEFAKDCIVSEGNHTAINNKYQTPAIRLPIEIQHVPIRSPAQIIKKSLFGSYALALKANRIPGEGNHWDEIAKKIRANNYSISVDEIKKLAARYATPENLVFDEEPNIDGTHIGTKTDNIVHQDLARVNLIEHFDKHIQRGIENQLRNKIENHLK